MNMHKRRAQGAANENDTYRGSFVSHIKSLPQDLLVEVLAKVAASSFFDLFNAKLVNKDFLRAATDGQIFRHVSLQNIPRVPWKTSPKFLSFVENCENNENSEALYRKGMIEFFSHRKEASGLANLKVSAEKGHVEASYVYGLVLYRRSKEVERLEFLTKCEAKGQLKMAECRRRIKALVREMWINNMIFSQEEENSSGRRNCDCAGKNIRRRMMGWDWADEENNYVEDTCEACKWNGEVSRFCNMLRTGGYN